MDRLQASAVEELAARIGALLGKAAGERERAKAEAKLALLLLLLKASTTP